MVDMWMLCAPGSGAEVPDWDLVLLDAGLMRPVRVAWTGHDGSRRIWLLQWWNWYMAPLSTPSDGGSPLAEQHDRKRLARA